MKTILLFLLVPVSSLAQQFSGFGNVRIGTNESDFVKAITNEVGNKLFVITEKSYADFNTQTTKYILNDNEPPRLYQFKIPEDKMYTPISFYGRDTKKLFKYQDSLSIYYLPVYKVGEITIKDVSVVCHRGNVVLIELRNEPDLIKAAKEKYPATFSLDTSYSVVCTYVVSGVKKEEKALKRIDQWKYTDSFVESNLSLEYDSKCKSVLVSSIKFESSLFLTWYLRVVLNENEKKEMDDEKKKQSVKEKI